MLLESKIFQSKKIVTVDFVDSKKLPIYTATLLLNGLEFKFSLDFEPLSFTRLTPSQNRLVFTGYYPEL